MASQSLHIASNLRRAQLSLIAAMQSLTKYADTLEKDQPGTPIPKNLKNAPFYINQMLQEGSAGWWKPKGIDAHSEFSQEMIAVDKCKTDFMNYLAKGFPDAAGQYNGNNDHWTSLIDPFVWDKIFNIMNVKPNKYEWIEQVLCAQGKLQYESVGASPMKNKFVRHSAYGRWLKKQMEAGQELIVIGGHSNWFQEFVDEHVRPDPKKKKNVDARLLLMKYGRKANAKLDWDLSKIANGHMVDVVVEPYKDSIQIVSIQEIFPEEKRSFPIDAFH